MCNGVRPRSAHVAERRVLPDPVLLTDHHTETVQLGRQALVELDDVIESIGDLSGEPGPFRGKPDREIAGGLLVERRRP